MGTMNFFRALASSFVVAVMGAIMLAGLGAAPQRGAASSTVVTAVGITANQLVRTFSVIFAVATGFLLIGIVALIMMEERPLRSTIFTTPSGRDVSPPGAE